MGAPIEVLVTLPFADHLMDRLRAVSPRLSFSVIKAAKTEEISAEVWNRIEILYTNRILPSPDQAPLLRWVQFHWAGVEHVVNESLITEGRVIATSLSGASASQMAEYVLTMILSLGHRLLDLLASQKRAEWPQDRWTRFTPLELRQSTVGIVGYGSIGRQVARLLQPFGATVLATKRDVRRPEDAEYVPAGMGDPTGELVHRLYPAEALRSMLKECDYVVITVPKTPATLRLISSEELAVMKPTAFLIDVSRGGIVDQEALLRVLRDRKIAGAALDVFPEEPLPSNSPLWKLPNVIITPHISGNTPNYDERAVELFAANLQRYLIGEPLFNRIDPQRGY